MSIPYDDLETYLDWVKVKADLNFSDKEREEVKIIPNCVYWAYMGSNVGSEEGKHRPVLVIRTYKKSTICTVLPLTTQRLNDGYWYHIDLENYESTVLCEQMRTIDLLRIDKPYRTKGKIMSISKKDWEQINKQVNWLYKMQFKPEE